MSVRQYLFCIVTLVTLCNTVGGTEVKTVEDVFDPQRHHFVLVHEQMRTKRSTENKMNEIDAIFNRTETGTEFVNGINETARIVAFKVNTDIRYRYARTLVMSRVANANPLMASEVTFQMVLPEAAFISKFLIEANGQVFMAYVKEKEEAKRVYTEAQGRGLSAGLVEVNARHANVFNVILNVQPGTTVQFNLTYEEFLIRKLGTYEQVIHIRPEQISEAPDYSISINILESQNITKIQVPKLTKNEMLAEEINNEAAVVQTFGNYATVNWKPSSGDKSSLEQDVGLKFILRYDIQHDSGPGEILLMNGYFVHFFAPSQVLPLRKHVVYVLDTSGSMIGRKLEQMKHVMRTVLDDLKPDDYFNIITFASRSNVVMPAKAAYAADPIASTEFALRKAHQLIDSLVAVGGTNVDAGLKDALEITSRVKYDADIVNSGTLPENVQSLILFLTDGDPTMGVTRPDVIVANAKERNTARVPIYTISFGSEPDFGFLKNLALQNYGFARKIYEGGDADIQIRGFYKEISSPLLSNITFKYTTNSSQAIVRRVTKQRFPNLVDGSELVVAGYLKDRTGSSNTLAVDIDANGRNGRVTLSGRDLAYDVGTNSNVSLASAQLEDEFLERLWAFITIKQLLEIHPDQNDSTVEDYVYEDFGEMDEELMTEDGDLMPPEPMTSVVSTNETARDRALRLALKYGFVTPITSLVVVKPEDHQRNMSGVNDVVNLEEAKVKEAVSEHRPLSRGGGMSRSANIGARSYGVTGRGKSRGTSSMSVMVPQSPVGLSGPRANLIDEPRQFDHAMYLPNVREPQQVYRSSPLPRHGGSSYSQPHPASKMASFPAWLQDIGGTKSMTDFPLPIGFRSRASAIALQHNPVHDPREGEVILDTLSRRRPTPSTTTTTTTKSPSIQSLVPWLSKDTIGQPFVTVDGTNYYVYEGNLAHVLWTTLRQCTGGTRHRRFQGTCRHFQDCLKPEFKLDRDSYVNNYFCEIPYYSGAGPKFAGVCCR